MCSGVCFQNGGREYAELEPVYRGLLDSIEYTMARSRDQAPAIDRRHTETQLINAAADNMPDMSHYCSVDDTNE